MTSVNRDEDDIEASKAPLMSHIIELRSRLVRSLIALFIGFIFCFVFANQIFLVLVWPFDWVMVSLTHKHAVLQYTAPQEKLLTDLRIAFYGGTFLSFPVIANQLYLFVAPGLYRHEKRAFLPYLIATPVFFIFGAALVYVMLPSILGFFASMQTTGTEDSIRIELLPRVSEYLSLIMSLTFAFGIVFQLPVVLTLLGQIGLIKSDQLRRFRRYAFLLAFILSALLAPPEPISQISLALPAYLLYELTIFAVRYMEKKRDAASTGTDLTR